MNKYKLMKENHQKEVNEFPMFFAFSQEQFAEGMKKLGLDPNEKDKICPIGSSGGFLLKSDVKKFKEMMDRHDKELKDTMSNDDQFIFDMFDYELGNHEYVVTYDPTDAIYALGLTETEVQNDERLYNALTKACEAQKEWYRLHG